MYIHQIQYASAPPCGARNIVPAVPVLTGPFVGRHWCPSCGRDNLDTILSECITIRMHPELFWSWTKSIKTFI